MIFPTKKNNIPTLLKSIVGDGYFFSGKPAIQSDQTLKQNNFFGTEQASVNDGVYLDFDSGSSAVLTYPEISIKSMCLTIKPDTTSENLFQLASGIYGDLTSGALDLTGFTTPTSSITSIGGGWSFFKISQSAAITADDIEIGHNTGGYGDFGAYNLCFCEDEIDFDYLKENPNATAADLAAYYGISHDKFYFMPCSEGAGNYAVDVGQELGSEKITSTWNTGTGWSETDTELVANNASGGGVYAANNVGLEISKNYIVEFKLNEITLGVLSGRIGTNWYDLGQYSFAGEYKALVTPGAPGLLGFQGYIDSISCKIDKSSISVKEIQAATISGCTWQTGQPDGRHTALDAFNTTEINVETVLLQDVGDGNDIIGNPITNTGLINLDGISSFEQYTTTDTINSVSFYYEGSVYTKNGADYYVDGAIQGGVPTPFVYYEDGNDRILGKSDGSTFHEGEYRNLLLAGTLSTSQISLLANLLKVF